MIRLKRNIRISIILIDHVKSRKLVGKIKVIKKYLQLNIFVQD
jgi:hypothetical protein